MKVIYLILISIVLTTGCTTPKKPPSVRDSRIEIINAVHETGCNFDKIIIGKIVKASCKDIKEDFL